MALVLDTGPLYALLDRDDADHGASRELIEISSEPLVVPAPVLVEVDQLVSRRLYSGIFFTLLDDIEAGALSVAALLTEDYARAA